MVEGSKIALSGAEEYKGFIEISGIGLDYEI